MRRGRVSRSARWAAVGLPVVIAVGGLLLAEAVEDPDHVTTATRPAQSAATQPAEASARDRSQTTQMHAIALRRQAAQQQLLSGLIGSKHDFTEEGMEGRDLCLPCHTPHLVGAPAPRLDRRPPSIQPLRPYRSLKVTLDGWSLLCLGCHDGVTAPDVYSSPHAISVSSQLGNSRLGTAGLRSHPIGIKYPSSSEEYHSPAAVEAAGLMLPEGRIQCTTCHDAHNTHRHAGMLRISNERSRMCLTCHRL